MRPKASLRASRSFSGAKLSESLCGQGAALMPANEVSEPFPQAPRLIRNLVKLARERTRPHVPEDIAWRQVGLLEPTQIAFAIIKPIDGRIDWSCDRIEEIQAGRPADKDRRRTAIHQKSCSGQQLARPCAKDQ